MSELPQRMPCLNQMKNFKKDSADLSYSLNFKLKFGDNLQKAYALHQHALQYSFGFLTLLSKLAIPMGCTVTGGVKQNLVRIAQRITENPIEINNPFRIFDMIRATITVNQPNQILELINSIESSSNFEMLRIKNKLDKHFGTVYLNVMYNEAIIAEIQIK